MKWITNEKKTAIIFIKTIRSYEWHAAIAQWIHLCLPSCRPGFQSDAHHLRFINLYLNCVMWKKTKVNKRGLDWFNCFLKKVRNLQLANAVLFDCAEDIFYAVEAYHYLPLCWIKYIILFSFQVGPKLFPIASHCLSVCLCVSLLWSSILSFSNVTKSMSRLICFSFCLSHCQPADSIITKVVSLLICFSFRTMSVCPSQITITVYILYIYLRSYYLYTQSFKHRYVHLCLYCSNSRLI